MYDSLWALQLNALMTAVLVALSTNKRGRWQLSTKKLSELASPQAA